MKRRDQYYCNIAHEIAMKSCMLQKHGCVIVYNNEIIARGVNIAYKKLNVDVSIHAEIDAINQLRKVINRTGDKSIPQRCKLYVVRVGTPSMDYPLKNSKPCDMCIKAIENIGIGKIYYSTNYEFNKAYNKYIEEKENTNMIRMQKKLIKNKVNNNVQKYSSSDSEDDIIKKNKRIFHTRKTQNYASSCNCTS